MGGDSSPTSPGQIELKQEIDCQTRLSKKILRINFYNWKGYYINNNLKHE